MQPEQPVVVNTPVWRNVQPRIPDTPQRKQLEKERNVREVVFGAKDGILTTMGVVIGLGVATDNHGTVVVSGLLALLAGALSMGVGEFQGAKSEREVVQAAMDLERSEMLANPQDEYKEQVAYYIQKGFSADEAHTIVDRLVQNPEIYFYEMMRDEFGIDPRIAESSDIRPALAMSGAYALGSFLPILPYLFSVSSRSALIASVVLAIVGLFGIGSYAGWLAKSSPIRRGFEIATYGTIVFVISFLAGHFIPPLFHMNAISLGG